MRPVKISIEGFSAYRKKVVVDLEDVEYFSLSGPTGAGKSSLIDAMVFALYGRIPRLGGGTIAPVISAGSERARVSLEFSVGVERYVATKLVQRTKSGGAAITEARLEHGDEVLASGVRETNEAVADLLRLSYEDFTRTVVLPQGEFARFLTAVPGERQQLLRGLLGLDVYGKVRALARSRETSAEARALDATTRLEALDLPDADEREAALERSAKIDELADTIADAEAELSRQQADRESLVALVERLEDAEGRLRDLAGPPRLEELAQLLSTARQELDDLEARREKLKQEKGDLEEALAGLPTLEKLRRLQTVKDRLLDVEKKLETDEVDPRKSELEKAEAEVANLLVEVDAARASLDRARIEHAAHELASHLSTGDRCPVCNKVVDEPLAGEALTDVEVSKSALLAGEENLEAARTRVAELANLVAASRSERKGLEEKRVELLAEVGDHDDLAALAKTRKAVEETLAKLQRVTVSLDELESPMKSKRGEFEDLAEEQRSLGNRLMTQREALADLKPTPTHSDDPIVQWKELLSWRDSKLGDIANEITAARRQLDEAEKAEQIAHLALGDRLAKLGIEFDGRFSVSVVRAQEQARHLVKRYSEMAEEAESLSALFDESNQAANIARSLSQHLRADGFERWLMVGAISTLVEGANSLLAQLSGDGYSLSADENGSFDVIDHRNANEIRSISTLSGGETFLVSLALALSLAETLSAAGGTGLDAIILDEGFGTLDDELLEVVASVLEELAGRGLMVGIITHVKELANLAPVRFRVNKEPDGARVVLAS